MISRDRCDKHIFGPVPRGVAAGVAVLGPGGGYPVAAAVARGVGGGYHPPCSNSSFTPRGGVPPLAAAGHAMCEGVRRLMNS